MKVRNRTVQCMADDPWTSRDYEDIKYLVIHRIGKKAGPDGPSIARKFREKVEYGRYVGFKMPYHFIIKENGEVDQCVELEYMSPHAGAFNWRSIGIAVIGDFRYHRPTVPQDENLKTLCQLLSRAFPGVQIVRHDELNNRGGSADPSKICPGKFLHLPNPQPNLGLSPLEAELELLKHGILL